MSYFYISFVISDSNDYFFTNAAYKVHGDYDYPPSNLLVAAVDEQEAVNNGQAIILSVTKVSPSSPNLEITPI